MIRVYKYWAEPVAKEDARQIDTQLKLALAYRRALAAVENTTRDQFDVLDRATPAIGERVARIEAIWQMPKDQRTEDNKQELIQLQAELKTLRKERQKDPTYADARTAIYVAQKAAATTKRGEASAGGLYWGTYLGVEDAHDRACEMTKPWDRLQGKTWSSIGIQIQARPRRKNNLPLPPYLLTTEAVIGGTDSRLQIDVERYAVGARKNGFRQREEGALNRGGHVRPKRLQELRLRVGMDENDQPIWCRMHIIMHRPMPAGHITWARIHRERIGLQLRYNVQLIVAEAVEALPRPGIRTVGVDIGWRRVPGGIRIGYAIDDLGRESTLVIPDHVLARRTKSDDLLAIRDGHRNAVKTQLGEWRKTLPEGHLLRMESEHLHVWNRVGRFVLFHRLWADNRVVDDEAIFEATRTWLHNDRHLLDWQKFNVRKLRQYVETVQTQWAVRVVGDCAILGVEDEIGISTMVRRESEEHEAATAHTEVSPGALKDVLIQVAVKRGCHDVEVPAPGTTTIHAACGQDMGDIDRRKIDVRCNFCGVVVDQDLNAAINIRNLARATVLAERTSPPAAGGSRGLEGKVAPRARRNRKKVGG